MKVIIAGSRDFQDYKKLEEIIDNIIKDNKINITEVVSGNDRGTDRLGEEYASRRNIPIKKFIPDWDKYGKKAGPLRNTQMADYGDILIAFDKGTPGTKNMIDNMTRRKKPLFVVNI